MRKTRILFQYERMSRMFRDKSSELKSARQLSDTIVELDHGSDRNRNRRMCEPNDVWLSKRTAFQTFESARGLSRPGYSPRSIMRGDKPSSLQWYRADNLSKLKQLHRQESFASAVRTTLWLSESRQTVVNINTVPNFFQFSILTA